MVLDKKKDGSTCIDYGRIDVVTRKDSYPLPIINNALYSYSGAKYFTTLDL